MKICWDNLEKLRYSRKTGKWYDKTSCYVYKDNCEFCHKPFLSQQGKGRFCNQKCFKNSKDYKDNIRRTHKGKKLSKNHIEIIIRTHKGKKISKETKEKMSISAKKRFSIKENHPMYGKHHSEKTKKKLSSYKGEKTSNWKGGVTKKKTPLYDTYTPQIDWCEEVRRSLDDKNVLEVRCTYCGKWYVPKLDNLRNRIRYINGFCNSENRLYCSTNCKKACPIYNKSPQILMQEDALRAGRLQWLELNREVQPELRQMVLKRDNYTCQKCGTADKPLHCHHIFPVTTDPLVSADIDNCITLCEDCHKQVHQKDGCRYNELQMEIC